MKGNQSRFFLVFIWTWYFIGQGRLFRFKRRFFLVWFWRETFFRFWLFPQGLNFFTLNWDAACTWPREILYTWPFPWWETFHLHNPQDDPQPHCWKKSFPAIWRLEAFKDLQWWFHRVSEFHSWFSTLMDCIWSYEWTRRFWKDNGTIDKWDREGFWSIGCI